MLQFIQVFWIVATIFAFALFVSIVWGVFCRVLDRYGTEKLKKLRKSLSRNMVGYLKMLFIVACPIIHVFAIGIMVSDSEELIDEVYYKTCNTIDELLASE